MRPLVKRNYKYKNYVKKFFCPLCSTERALFAHSKLQWFHYVQISLFTFITTVSFFSFWEYRSAFVFFIYWAAYDFVIRMRYKKEIPCPHCGFDATTYKKNVVKARNEVESFWDSQNQDSLES